MSMSIGEVADQSGVSTSAIRYYERAGLLPAPRRVSGRRVFDDPVLDELTFIRSARSAGFGISEIRQMIWELGHIVRPGDRWRIVADAKIMEIDSEIAELSRRRELLQDYKRCECETLEDYRLGR